MKRGPYRFVVASLIAVFGVLAYAVAHGLTQDFDLAVRDAIHARAAVPLTWVLQVVTRFGGSWFLWPFGAAIGILFRFGRPVRRAARIAVIKDLTFRRRSGALRRDRGRGHAGRQAGVPITARRARAHTERQQDRACKARHGVTWSRGT